ncbi:hypothetical protein CLM62_34395 [Streptomyces sp. SA15]|nr:hypothetical protein CLM62_34395 [Streptomyces sp. SA15]
MLRRTVLRRASGIQSKNGWEMEKVVDDRGTRVAEKIRGWTYTPGKGAGVLVDPLQPKRRTAAKRLAGQQT